MRLRSQEATRIIITFLYVRGRAARRLYSNYGAAAAAAAVAVAQPFWSAQQ